MVHHETRPIIVPEAEHQVTEVRVGLQDTEVQADVAPDTEAQAAEVLDTVVQEVVALAQGVRGTEAQEVAQEVLVTAGVQVVQEAPVVCEALVVLPDLQEVEDPPEAVAAVAEGINHPNIL